VFDGCLCGLPVGCARIQLVRMFPKSDVATLGLGPTSFGRNLDAEYLHQRQLALDEFLQALLDIPEVIPA
jgi:hypothetical protein